VAAFAADEASDLVLISSAGQLLRTAVSAVPVQGAGARGVAGMRLKPEARVIAAGAGTDHSLVVTVAGSAGSASSVKVTALSHFPRTGRDGIGVRCHRLLAAESALLAAAVGPAPLACSPGGKPLPLPDADDRRDASGSASPAAKILIGQAAAAAEVADGVLFD